MVVDQCQRSPRFEELQLQLDSNILLAFKIVTQETYPSWGYILTNEATTLWERWESLTEPGMNSHNHPMMGSVSSWFHKYLGGINPDQDMPGFKRVVIRPYPLGDLKCVRAEYRSPYGLIRSSWSKEETPSH